MRVLATGLVTCAGLGLLLTVLPRGEAKSYGHDDFAAGWPNLSGASNPATVQALRARGMRVAMARQPMNAPSGTLEPLLTSYDLLFGGIISGVPDGFALIRPSPQLDKAARRLKAAHNQVASLGVQSRRGLPVDKPLADTRTELVKFASAPFPYEGAVPGTDRPFLNVVEGDQKGHRTSRGRVLWEDQTFSDNRVLLHIPSSFDIDKPAVMVVFFHGHGAELTRDVLNRQQVPEQITMSGVNAVLVAPQFAIDAADSSPGRFWQPGGFGRFVGEAGKKLAQLYGDPKKARQFDSLPVVIVAYSGGFSPAAWSIERGGLGSRLHGIVLMDALYGDLDVFAKWIKHSPSAFLVSAYTSSTRRHNLEFARMLDEEHVPYSTKLGKHLWHGGVALLSTDSVRHRDFVTRAWTDNPIRDVLAKLN